MARKNSNIVLLVGLIVVVALFAGWMMMKGRNVDNGNSETNNTGSNSDIQFIEGGEPAHSDSAGVQDDLEFIETDDETGMNADQMSIGTGPGIWGSPRHTSEF